MKLKQLLCISLLFIAAFSFAQNKNPFQSIGKKGEILTLTKGTYEELFDQDSIQQIGTTLINVRSMKIVSLGNDENEGDVMMDNARHTRFKSIDPLASSFPWLTPYQYAGNKPIWCVDLDGLEETGYTMYLDRVFSDPKLAAKFHEDMKPLQKPGMYVTGGLVIATLAVLAPETLPFIFRGMAWAASPANQALVVTIGGFALEMVNPDPNYQVNLPGPGDEMAHFVKLVFKTKTGKIVEGTIEKGARFANQSEVNWFGKLLNEGKNVTLLAEKQGQKNADYAVNGVFTEIKELSNMQEGKNMLSNLVNKFRSSGKQATTVIIDGINQKGFTKSLAEQAIKEVRRKGIDHDTIYRIVGEGFEINQTIKGRNK
ncbi:MAG: hypothetical protein ABIP35_03785 [Ginsengibacter sp.]